MKKNTLKNEDRAGPKPQPGLHFSRLLIGLLVGAGVIYLVSRELSWREVAAALAGVRPGWLAAALAAAFAGQTVKAVRWRRMLASERNPPSLPTVWVFHLTGQLGNIFIPGPAGDVGRIVILGGRGQGRIFTMGTVALEKVLDLIAFGFLVAVVLVSAPLPDWIAESALMLLGLSVVVAAGFWVALRFQARLAAAAAALVAWLPAAWARRAGTGLKAAGAALGAVRGRRQAFRLTLATCLLWTASLAVNRAVAEAFGLDLPPIAPVLLLVVLQVGVSTNIVPGTIGLFEFLCIQTLSLYDVPPQTAFSFGLLLHAVVLAPLLTAAALAAVGAMKVEG
ncbi:MAG TPA: lysylphosphatidylglycerol synthase transmembrane domain-containing protein [Anaerolineales bacterium]|nr:lysylphosphatidylglycerol synthase transmembrane domain-containing protein [Anaerolineales bacterium]